jgi:hypothetical protein
MPELICPAEERNVCWIFPIGESNNTGQAVRRPSFVRDVKLLQAKDAYVSLGKVKQRGASHATHAYHDDVVRT